MASRWLHKDVDRFFKQIENSSEISQSFESFCTSLKPQTKYFGPSPTRDTIYIAELNDPTFLPLSTSELDLLSQFLRLYFMVSKICVMRRRLQLVDEAGCPGIRVDEKLFYPGTVDVYHRYLATDMLGCLADLVPSDAITYVPE